MIKLQRALLERQLAIGLMSGTSLDGIDAALVEIEGSGPTLRAQLRHFLTLPFAAPMRARLLEVSQNGRVQDAARLNVELGELFAQAALQLIETSDFKIADIHFIGSHGQTICHLPRFGASLQIGEPSIIAERTGLTTVADFRPRDLAAGGQGAPLVPYVDWCLLRRDDCHRIVQNIGGIGNCTLLPQGAGLENVRAWDTGPGNMVMDEAARVLTNGQQLCDQDGAMALRGHVDAAWLVELMRHPFLHQAPPKSAGREEFGQDFAAQFVKQGHTRGLGADDILATATAWTAHSIAHSYASFALPQLSDCSVPIEVILGGGGAFNPTLCAMLNQALDANALDANSPRYNLLMHEDIGLRSDAKEAMSFAILAHETLQGRANNVPGATGAKHPVVLGKIIPGKTF